MRNAKYGLLFAAMVAAGSVNAQDVMGDNHARAIGEINTQVDLLKAEIQLEEARQSLTALRKAGQEPVKPTPEMEEAKKKPEKLPFVKAIEGVGTDRVAVLTNESGAQMEVRSGDVLPGEMVVTDVQPNRVTVKHRGKPVTLPFASGELVPTNR